MHFSSTHFPHLFNEEEEGNLKINLSNKRGTVSEERERERERIFHMEQRNKEK